MLCQLCGGAENYFVFYFSGIFDCKFDGLTFFSTVTDGGKNETRGAMEA